MWKVGLAGIVAFAMMGSSLVFAQSEATLGKPTFPAAQFEGVVSYAQIARLKSELKLTPDQEPLWVAVEMAFREIGQQQFEGGSQGLVQSIKTRAASIGLNVQALRRLAEAAYPLIKTLNDEQKQSAISFARSAGLESVAAAF